MKKKIFGFSYSKNMANFEAFLWSFSSSTNSEIVKSVFKTTRIPFRLSFELNPNFSKCQTFKHVDLNSRHAGVGSETKYVV